MALLITLTVVLEIVWWLWVAFVIKSIRDLHKNIATIPVEYP